jgi:hypothetical protein
MKFELSSREGFFEVKTYGDAEPGGIKESINSMLAHEKWKPGTSFLIDHSELNFGHLTINEIHAIASACVRLRAELGQARCATLAPRDEQYGLVRMWEAFIDGKWDVIHQAFRSRDEAVSWLMNDRRKGQESPGPAAY